MDENQTEETTNVLKASEYVSLLAAVAGIGFVAGVANGVGREVVPVVKNKIVEFRKARAAKKITLIKK